MVLLILLAAVFLIIVVASFGGPVAALVFAVALILFALFGLWIDGEFRR